MQHHNPTSPLTETGKLTKIVEVQGDINLNPITRRQILDSFKLKELADNNLKFDENGRKLSKWVENTVGKGEIAHYEQFLLLPQCFQRLISQGRQKVSFCGNGLNHMEV